MVQHQYSTLFTAEHFLSHTDKSYESLSISICTVFVASVEGLGFWGFFSVRCNRWSKCLEVKPSNSFRTNASTQIQ